ncbi:hypothetical protein FR483_n590R [Paramecium bursaria Chlorella virus FR483]|uniref:Uncharacterized protein n590R n=1 Tax=Paramecium bursaria Chlorella virus FR483 TaxID=399781 RepID=A7J7U4_PBCVF|nr:hypothetical protein FR483_n590R [Paramecium bursaria Chlorella virus FR483]ABT15875.1 hypothetical protein FR483_n590R [Paramecium bursaria Chlorella virus FR483]
MTPVHENIPHHWFLHDRRIECQVIQHHKYPAHVSFLCGLFLSLQQLVQRRAVEIVKDKDIWDKLREVPVSRFCTRHNKATG